MVRPNHFGFNSQTAGSNSFQNQSDQNVSQRAQEEFDNAVNILRSNHIDVKVFEDQSEILPDAIFPNNWISHVPNKGVVVYPMLTPNRKAEVRFDIVDWAQKQLNENVLFDLRDDIRILEGTGSVVFDHVRKIAFACESPRTDLSLLKDFCDNIGYQTVSFLAVDLKGDPIYHTNVVMSLGDKVAIICLESIPDILERTMVKKSLEKLDKEIIEITYAQMNHFAGNALEVVSEMEEVKYVMSQTAFDSLSSDQISKIEKHASILVIDIPTIENIGGGSIRCMMAGFFNYPR